MSQEQPGPEEPTQERAAGAKDARSAYGAGGGPDVPPPATPGREVPWTPPGGNASQQGPWEQQAWQQQRPPGPAAGQQPPQPPHANSPYPGAPYPGTPYGGHAYGARQINGAPYGGPPKNGSPYPGPQYGAPFPAQPRYVAPPKPGIIPLRPLLFGEVLDGSFQAIRRNAKAILGAGLLAQALSAILAAVLTGFIATSSGSVESWAATAGRTGAGSPGIGSLGIGLMVGLALLSILSVFISAVLQGAMVVPVARSVLNRPTGFRRMLSLARPRIGALIGLAALLVAAAMAAVMLFFLVIVLVFSNVRGVATLLVVPLMLAFSAMFLWVAIKMVVAPAAVVIEELGAFAAVRRSWELTRGNWWRIFGISLVVAILVGVITQVVLIPASILPAILSGVVSPHGGSGRDAGMAVAMGIITAVIGALLGAVGYAFQTSVMALLYMDLRMRKDGLDIELLRELETGADPGGVPGRGPHAAGSTPYPGYVTPPGAWPHGR
ncbi:hypothetical protein [Pseudarthrobacter enclensis]|uniref:DUF7847 domain-containing protein n=1 Tax=Pseudarthrobacter enclensis TaxID=993070 RepID=A0ABT9RVG5_9MICC|nr:hypothetical protein [Pseudarthrobacter enclensis]MDP9888204.1 hypothetical protein [Pseudarthrobacter enclensis]